MTYALWLIELSLITWFSNTGTTYLVQETFSQLTEAEYTCIASLVMGDI